ncbi:unnamed protein product, partial [Lampetra fluviatilis]
GCVRAPGLCQRARRGFSRQHRRLLHAGERLHEDQRGPLGARTAARGGAAAGTAGHRGGRDDAC